MSCARRLHPVRAGRSARGAMIVEFALISLVFFYLLIAILEFGRAIWIYGTVAHAASEGARWAVVRGATSGQIATKTQLVDHVKGRATGIDPTDLTVTTNWPNTGGAATGSVVTVTVSYGFDWIAIPIPGITTLSGSASMTVQ